MHLSLTLSDLAAEWPALLEYVYLVGLGFAAGSLAIWGYWGYRIDRVKKQHAAAMEHRAHEQAVAYQRALMEFKQSACVAACRQFRLGLEMGRQQAAEGAKPCVVMVTPVERSNFKPSKD